MNILTIIVNLPNRKITNYSWSLAKKQHPFLMEEALILSVAQSLLQTLSHVFFQKSIFGNSHVLMKNVITRKIRPLCGAYVTRTATTNRTFTMLISPKTEPDTQTKSTVEQTYDHFLKTNTMNQSTILPLLRQT